MNVRNHGARHVRAGLLLAASFATWAISESTAAAEPTAPLDLVRTAGRIVMLGDSATHAGGWVADFAAWMEARGFTGEVINVALPGETCSLPPEEAAPEPSPEGRRRRPIVAERLDRVLTLTRPDLVIACYGRDDGLEGARDEARLARFKQGLERLHDAIEASGAKVIHITPAPTAGDRRQTPDGDGMLDEAMAWLIGKRADGWIVVDVRGVLEDMLAAARSKDPSVAFTPDAIRPDEPSAWLFCRAVLAGLGDDAAAAKASPEWLAGFLPDVTLRMQTLRDAYVTAAGHSVARLPRGLPIGEAEAKARELTGWIRLRRPEMLGHKGGGGVWQLPIVWPRPPVVDPGPPPQSAAPVPSDAIVLFDGATLDAWRNAAGWTVADGVATIGKGSIQSIERFGDCQLHVEFRMPSPPNGKGQKRGNSGIFFMERYEIQLLDSFEDGTDGPLTNPDGQCGALYKLQPPAVNACRGPGEWQTMDILFTRPRFRPDGTVRKPGRVSVLHNGVAIHIDTLIKGNKPWTGPPVYTKHADALPIAIQDHGNPVQFRSIWIRPFEPLVPEIVGDSP